MMNLKNGVICILSLPLGIFLAVTAIFIAQGDGFCIERHNGPQCYKDYAKLAFSAMPLTVALALFIGCIERLTGKKSIIMGHAASVFTFFMLVPIFLVMSILVGLRL